ncbi:MAG: alpha-hydroxy-acid oxidizing enzyme [Betaproteobacteria bacterium RIFCSPLOWO2_02_FULL_63_19]|nr:MAG: alpha-hydroxy-acid oxidizing enzyme [Betaproteobacteria bacterium RIFCSPLOWO2_02_FULL_63_19]
MARLRRIFSLQDFEPAARRRLPKSVFGFVAGGAEDGRAVQGNRAAFDDYALRPRVLVDVSARSQAVTLFGKRYASPFGISPMGACALCWFEADLALARAASAAGLPFVLSGPSSIPMERVIKEAPGAWYQSYLPAGRERIGRLLERAATAGYEVLVVTVDVPVGANRENNLRNGFGMPVRLNLQLALDGLLHPRWLVGTLATTLLRSGIPHFENYAAERGAAIIAAERGAQFAPRDAFTWSDIGWIRSQWKGKLVVKGILRADDARRAREEGADGIVVSNHGGRQLDGAIAPLRVLPEVVEAAKEAVVMMDGGIRRGTDVLKALALGAKFVFTGRPMLLAAAVAGEEGVRHAIALLRQEIDRDLALLGCADISALGRDMLAE